MKTYLILILIVLIQDTFQTKLPEGVGSSFSFQVRDFYEAAEEAGNLDKESRSRLKTLKIKFEDMSVISQTEKFAGYCFYEINEVWVDKEFWMKISWNQRQSLIDHELGHCILGRIHRHKKTENMFISIMAPAGVFENYGGPTKKLVRKELFTETRYHKMDELQRSIFIFSSANQVLIPAMKTLASDRDIAKSFEDRLNADSNQDDHYLFLNNLVTLSQKQNPPCNH